MIVMNIIFIVIIIIFIIVIIIIVIIINGISYNLYYDFILSIISMYSYSINYQDIFYYVVIVKLCVVMTYIDSYYINNLVYLWCHTISHNTLYYIRYETISLVWSYSSHLGCFEGSYRRGEDAIGSKCEC